MWPNVEVKALGPLQASCWASMLISTHTSSLDHLPSGNPGLPCPKTSYRGVHRQAPFISPGLLHITTHWPSAQHSPRDLPIACLQRKSTFPNQRVLPLQTTESGRTLNSLLSSSLSQKISLLHFSGQHAVCIPLHCFPPH